MRYLSRQTGEQLRAPSSLDAAVSGAVVFARSDRTPPPDWDFGLPGRERIQKSLLVSSR